MAKKKARASDDALELLQRRKRKQEAEAERIAADKKYEREWRNAWLATLAVDPDNLPPHAHHGPMVPWSSEREPIIVRLAIVVKQHGSDVAVSDIAERIRRWLVKVDEPQVYKPPLATLRPLSGNWKDESYIGYVESVMACAMVLQRAIQNKTPLVPEGLDLWRLRSDGWGQLGEEVSRKEELSLDPVPHVPTGRCGDGHEWIIENPNDSGPILCPICENKKQEAKRKAIEGFVYRLSHVTNETRDSTADEPEVYFRNSTLNEALIFAAFKVGLCGIAEKTPDAARLVIRWGVGTTGQEREAVAKWTVADAIERLNDAASSAGSDAKDAERKPEGLEEPTEAPNELEPGETTLADAAESSLSGVPLRLFQRLRQNQRYVSFDTLRADVWSGKSIQDRGIEAAIERLNTALLDTRFAVEKNAKRAKLTGI